MKGLTKGLKGKNLNTESREKSSHPHRNVECHVPRREGKAGGFFGEMERLVRIGNAVWNHLGLEDPADVERWLGAACVAFGLAEASLAPASPGAISKERAHELKSLWRSLVAGVGSGVDGGDG